MPFENPALPRGFDADFLYSEPPRAEEKTVGEGKTSSEEFSAQIEERRTLLEKLDVRRGRGAATRRGMIWARGGAHETVMLRT